VPRTPLFSTKARLWVLSSAVVILGSACQKEDLTGPKGVGNLRTSADSLEYYNQTRGSVQLSARNTSVEVVMDSTGIIIIDVIEYYACADNELQMSSPDSKSWPLPANCAGGPSPGPREVIGPYPAGTVITLEFSSGVRGGSASNCLNGGFPLWDVMFEDGGGGTCNDATVQIIIDPPIDPDCPDLPEFKGSGLIALNNLWKASNPEGPISERTERGGWLFNSGDSLNPTYEIKQWEGFANQCKVSAKVSDLNPPPNTVSFVHTHVLPPGNYTNICNRAEITSFYMSQDSISPGDKEIASDFGLNYVIDERGMLSLTSDFTVTEYPGCIVD
jgi:hypothetical protein